jgi:glutamate-1-semialdehyde 2,1-aminomutase
MVSSGTEAAMSAIRLARAATGREKLLKFAGAYHGHSDGLLAEAGSGVATALAARGNGPSAAAAGVPASPGVTEAQAAGTIVVPWNDREALREALAEHEVAAILAEPYPANMGFVPPHDHLLPFLREEADRNGALLVFDEVISGFRVSRGGAQEREGVTPDLTVLGKVIGGGLPAAAYAGSRELMEMMAPAGDVYQAGTLSGNPLATAAGLETLKLLDGSAYEHLTEITRELAQGMEATAREAGVPVHVTWTTGLLTVFFREGPVESLSDAKQCDLDTHAAFCRAMLERGVYLPPSQFEVWFPSLAHDEGHVERTLAAARDSLAEVAR